MVFRLAAATIAGAAQRKVPIQRDAIGSVSIGTDVVWGACPGGVERIASAIRPPHPHAGDLIRLDCGAAVVVEPLHELDPFNIHVILLDGPVFFPIDLPAEMSGGNGIGRLRDRG